MPGRTDTCLFLFLWGKSLRLQHDLQVLVTISTDAAASCPFATLTAPAITMSAWCAGMRTNRGTIVSGPDPTAVMVDAVSLVPLAKSLTPRTPSPRRGTANDVS